MVRIGAKRGLSGVVVEEEDEVEMDEFEEEKGVGGGGRSVVRTLGGLLRRGVGRRIVVGGGVV